MTQDIAKETPTGLLFSGSVPLPIGFGKEFATDASLYDIALLDDGSLSVTPAIDDVAAAGSVRVANRNGKLALTPELLEATGWPAGQVLEYILTGEALQVRGIDGRAHRGFTNPRRDADGLPIPPNWLAQAFTSSLNVNNYLRRGLMTAEKFAEMTAKHGLTLTKGMTALDFGCGSGRVGRYFPKVTGADVIGVDLHKDAIEWCQAHMPYGKFMVGTVAPPLDLPDNSVDALLAVSVLTHLDDTLEKAWLAEWKRVMKPGGIAVVTYHGEGVVAAKIPKGSRMDKEVTRQWQEHDGIAFIDNKAWAGIFPDAYQTTYHSNDHVRRVWGQHFEILELVPSGGFINQHDVAILRA